ncbi:hypothetical protein JTZ62_04425 [Mammaliicoccus sciuri]|uniref:hypothetical protein n=1 Tax=Mammaliicoccus sciuri TaxID=1296 RepID=UPI0019D32827|nr:hypothetical protein [Mammaliicoccus sciuri]MEB6232610.1 hypothetical protein [Mammaliicoccus sciuri]QSN68408.1 hypothetical protein JTZ62_04425 [Mammaliicoccus sciuri]UIU23146.1 hypothetical protein LLZ87_04435 [Mammaliicoccus sciuri]UIU26051.1 hypothetical protein LLZ92_04435 [Mammaliicoccus sciuri]
MNFSNSIPMSTQLLSKYESEDNDIRFTKVKIWLMHLGANRNGSVFNKDVVEKAIPTLANTPIMASVGFDMFDNKDFEGHESDIEISENGELKFVNKTFPFGVIPENNNAKFETRLGDDMVEREYLTCEGILWNKWEDAVEIIYGKNGVTGQSMELSDSYKGVYDGEFFEFTEFQFFGACMLGDDVLPAMNNSTVELKYASKTKDIIKEKMELFNSISFSSTEGGNTLSKEDVKKFEDNEEVTVEEPEKNDESTLEDPKENVEDVPEESNEETPVIPDAPKAAADTVVVDPQTIEDIAEVRKGIKKQQEDLPEPVDMIIVSGVEYSAKDIESLIAEKDSFKANFKALQKEVHEEKVNALFSKFSNQLEAEEMKELKEKANDLSVTELETQIFAVIGKKNYSTKPINQNQEKEIKFSAVKFATEDKHNTDLDAILNSLK